MTSVAFSVSHPFRQPMYKNWMFVFFIAANLFFAFYFIHLNEHEWLNEVFFFVVIPGSFRHWLLLIIFGNCLLTYLFEKVAIKYLSEWNYRRQERIRCERIDEEVIKARAEINLYFELK